IMESTIDVLYEDNHIIAVNKPAGLLSQPTDIENDSLEIRVKAWIKEKYQKPGNVFVGVVHRLDKPTSGILIFAKTSKALSRLNQAMRAKEMQKTYCAFVEGNLKKKEGTLDHFLVHGEHSSYVSDRSDKDAKPARLHYETLKENGKSSLLQIVLETGRYHQIRCQFSAIGHPIIGDLRYGAKKDQKFLPQLPPNSVALHHTKMTLIHPVTKAALCIEAPLPHYFL
ncbi:MAG TPA: RNA pseudouridine synthase, partial [Parachlamydiaceae bacterium]|nr:RNA pseudouridine synthase [Parachlamydiaceae bacterium]